uniref:Major facilitator superfamily (MFS) profile domain-containing protein n=1 Tax=Megaselia scalaris TaxID=36166 RepID=T1GMR4_MEGSC
MTMKLSLNIHNFNAFRYIQCGLLFLGLFSALFDRGSTPIIVTALSKESPSEWKFQDRQYILSSFYWGYVVTQILGGYLANKYGMKFLFLISILGPSLLSLLMPTVITFGGWKAYAAVNMFKGLIQGLMYPAIYYNISKWAPKPERNIMSNIVETGFSWGQLLSPFISGKIAASNISWPGIFYLNATIGIPRRFQIRHGKGEKPHSSKSRKRSMEDPSDKPKPIPWTSILTSPPFLALILVTACQELGYTFINSEVPQFFNALFNLDIESNGLNTTLIQIPTLVMMHVYAIVGYILLKRRIVGLTVLRKSYNAIACIIPTAIYIALTQLDGSQQTLTMVLIAIIASTLPAQDIAYWINVIDLSPRFSAVLYGIINTTTSIMSMLSPLIIGSIVSEGE